MIDTIDPAALPSIPFQKLDTLPWLSAVYFALSESGDFLYIGRADRLRGRWRRHHRIFDLQNWNAPASRGWPAR